MALLWYFKRSNPLPSPEGPLSMKVSSSSIQAANNKVEEAMSQESSTTAGNKKRGPYKKYTATEKAEIGNYALQNGTTAALRHFRTDFPDMKWTTVNGWKVAIEKEMKEEKLKGTVMQLEGKNRGRPHCKLRSVPCTPKCLYTHTFSQKVCV